MIIKSREVAAGLRELADRLDSMPETEMCETPLSKYFYTGNAESLAKFIAAIKSMGSFQKIFTDEYFKARIECRGGVSLEFLSERKAVCTSRKVTKEIEVVEWDCESILDKHLLDQGI